MSFEDLESGRVMLFNGSTKRSTQVQQDYGDQHPSTTCSTSSSRVIVGGVFKINTAVASFLRLVHSIGTPKDTVQFRQKLEKARLHIADLVKETSEKLKEATETDQYTETSAAKKIADAKIAKDFQSVLREFQKAQRLAAERQKAYKPIVDEVLPSRNIELDVSSFRSPEEVSLLVESQRQEVLRVENEIAFNEAAIEERDQGIREIQKQIGEVNEIFKDLAVMVHEQGTMIDDISSNVGNTHSSTKQATFQITEASKTQKSISSMSCLLLVILGIVLLIVFVVVLA